VIQKTKASSPKIHFIAAFVHFMFVFSAFLRIDLKNSAVCGSLSAFINAAKFLSANNEI
jgi:hypothetical protein